MNKYKEYNEMNQNSSMSARSSSELEEGTDKSPDFISDSQIISKDYIINIDTSSLGEAETARELLIRRMSA